jgi:hypothetical protein
MKLKLKSGKRKAEKRKHDGPFPLSRFPAFRFSALLACLLLAGCATSQPSAGQNKTGARPSNTFANVGFLPARLQRVAMLPVASEPSDPALAGNCEALRPVIREELIRTRKFEVVSVDPELLRRRTGRTDWTGGETLPADFLGLLQREYGCDAVLFCQLTTFRAYAPLTIGWRMKMVDVHTRQIIWAADEVFDTAKAPASFRGWLVQQVQEACGPESPAKWAAKNSPDSFSHAAAARLLATLPER